MTSTRAGAALLEALVALVILATAAVSAARLVTEAGQTVSRAREAEGDVRRASAFMHAVALWSREDLDRHLGERDEGPWVLHVERMTPRVYDVTIAQRSIPTDFASSRPSGRVLLATSLYRP
jgi:type II secretory pathway pseudopilin PulG